MSSPELTLRLADESGLKWAHTISETEHYLRQRVHQLARPIAYIAMCAGERVGCLIFDRPLAARVRGWYGRLSEVQAGECPFTQWEIINLARVYLSPALSEAGSPLYAQHAASSLINEALERVVVDYLLRWPPVWMDQPWPLRQCLSYCQSLIFPCTIYQAAHFHLVRTNDYGLRTYAKNLRDLFPHEVELIREASRSDSRARQKRAAKKFQDTIRLDPLLHRDRARRRSAA